MPPSLLIGAARVAARAVVALPRSLQRLAFGAGIRRDGLVLAPEVQTLAKLAQWVGVDGADQVPVPEERQRLRRKALIAGGRRRAVAELRPVDAGGVPARLYVPPEAPTPSPLALWYHGGGHVVGDLETHDPTCRWFAREAGVRVLAVDYRLAPEHPFPAAVEDALTAFRHAATHASDLGADPARIAVAGDSAGGNLAAVVAQLAAGDDVKPAFQLLIYPVCDYTREWPSYGLFADGFFLTRAEMRWYRSHYLPDDTAESDPRASPLVREDLNGLAPAYIATAGFDPLRDEAEAYAHRLRAAGVPVTLRRFASYMHGFASIVGLGERVLGPARETAAALRWGLAGRP
jgi:acetyl esterase/lipase